MLQGARILIVDDERTTRLSLSEIFYAARGQHLHRRRRQRSAGTDPANASLI